MLERKGSHSGTSLTSLNSTCVLVNCAQTFNPLGQMGESAQFPLVLVLKYLVWFDTLTVRQLEITHSYHILKDCLSQVLSQAPLPMKNLHVLEVVQCQKFHPVIHVLDLNMQYWHSMGVTITDTFQ